MQQEEKGINADSETLRGGGRNGGGVGGAGLGVRHGTGERTGAAVAEGIRAGTGEAEADGHGCGEYAGAM